MSTSIRTTSLALSEFLLYVLSLYLPYCRAWLLTGMVRMLFLLALTLLLLFLVARRSEVGRAARRLVCWLHGTSRPVAQSVWLVRRGRQRQTRPWMLAQTPFFNRPPPVFI